MRNIILFATFVALFVTGCSQAVEEKPLISNTDALFYASLADTNTKTYIDGTTLRWNASDAISIFMFKEVNSKYIFQGKSGDTSGTFANSSDDFFTGTSLSHIYSIYPYYSSTTLQGEGEIATTLSATQSYANSSFGANANVMVAVTEDTQDRALYFKNACGYLKLKLYGANTTVKSIALRGNDGEILSGKAIISAGYGESPIIEMQDATATSLTLDCGEGVEVGATADEATEFWFVVPPTTFERGFTISVTNNKDEVFEHTTSNRIAVERNVIKPMAAVELAYQSGGDDAPDAEQIVATLTYEECSDVIAGYKNARTYTNEYGTWTVCAYDYTSGKAIQTNSGKVAYIGTPTFEGDITKIKLEFSESYSGDIYLCTEAGSTSASGKFAQFDCGGKAVEYAMEKSGYKMFYIRSSACARITKVTIEVGGTTGGTTPDPEPDPEPEPDPDPNPDNPTPNPDTTISTAPYDWAELPVIVDTNGDGRLDGDTSLYYAHHLCAGGENNAQRSGSARNYTVCYSAKHHCPLWVAAPRHSSYESGASRTDAYGKDPSIPSSIQYSSKSTGGGCNKGHMLGSADRLSSSATNRQVFYYTNIAPQYTDTFNTGGGAWNNLEDHIDGLVCRDTLYTVIGCYFDSFSRNGASASPKTISFGGRSDVSCPTMFYYAVLRTKSGSTGKRVQDCAASELKCAAFVICHKMAKGHKPEAADMMSIAELERLTGVTYFPNVPNAPKDSFDASEWL